MSKLSKAEQAKIEARRAYQRKWAKENKAKKNAVKMEAAVGADPDPFLTVLDAYVTLYNATDDKKIKDDANKLLAAILPKL